MNLLYEFIKYKWQAKGRHGIHSPFVYDFVEKVLKNKLNSKELNQANEYHNFLQRCDIEIEFNEFGAGSKLLKKTRRIKDMFALSSSKGKYGKLLYLLVKHYKPEKIVEFGTSLGVGTLQMHLASKSAEITTVEGCKNTHAFTLKNFPLKNPNVNFILSSFEAFCLQEVKNSYDLIFIDGHHDGEYLLRYLRLLDDQTHDNTLLILDDIRWSKSMFDAWKKLSTDKKYHVSIDLFRVGILVKKPDQAKEHFILQY
ncbi:MAG: class I SAM-dependent methyltransferase [Bacteroidetes bacterium]|nr:class I SAM-dependent methyltransferase [Bacteroidota bacterium]